MTRKGGVGAEQTSSGLLWVVTLAFFGGLDICLGFEGAAHYRMMDMGMNGFEVILEKVNQSRLCLSLELGLFTLYFSLVFSF